MASGQRRAVSRRWDCVAAAVEVGPAKCQWRDAPLNLDLGRPEGSVPRPGRSWRQDRHRCQHQQLRAADGRRGGLVDGSNGADPFSKSRDGKAWVQRQRRKLCVVLFSSVQLYLDSGDSHHVVESMTDRISAAAKGCCEGAPQPHLQPFCAFHSLCPARKDPGICCDQIEAYAVSNTLLGHRHGRSIDTATTALGDIFETRLC